MAPGNAVVSLLAQGATLASEYPANAVTNAYFEDTNHGQGKKSGPFFQFERHQHGHGRGQRRGGRFTAGQSSAHAGSGESSHHEDGLQDIPSLEHGHGSHFRADLRQLLRHLHDWRRLPRFASRAASDRHSSERQCPVAGSELRQQFRNRHTLLRRGRSFGNTVDLERAIYLERPIHLERAIYLERFCPKRQPVHLERAIDLGSGQHFKYSIRLGSAVHLERAIDLERERRQRFQHFFGLSVAINGEQ